MCLKNLHFSKEGCPKGGGVFRVLYWLHMRRFLLAAVFLILAPLPLLAATAGELVKVAGNPAVYYFGADGKRYVFPNSASYFTWYEGFSAVKTISSEELAAMPIGGNVTYRPGTRMVKIQSDPKVYAVSKGGVLRHVASEAVATCLFGANWNVQIDDVSDAFFVDYDVAEPIDHCVTYDPGAERNAAPTIGADKGLETVVVPPPTVPTLSVVAGAAAPKVGQQGTLMELRLRTPVGVVIKRLPTQLDALYGSPVEGVPDTDVGGLVRGAGVRPNLKDLRWIDAAGNQVLGVSGLSLATADDQRQLLEFGGAWQVPAGGDARIRLVATFDGELSSGEAYRTSVPVSGIVMEDTVGASMSFLPTLDLVGQDVAVSGDAFTISVAPLSGDKVHVRGADAVDLGSFTLRAGNATSAFVRSIAFQGYVDEQEGAAGFLPGGDADNGTETRVRDLAPSLRLVDEQGNAVAGPVTVTHDGRAVFSGMNVAMAAGTVRTFTIRGDLSPDAPIESFDDRLAFDIVDASTDVEAYAPSGARIASSGQALNGGASPTYAVTIRKHGALTMAWTGVIGPAVTGRETHLGTLELTAVHDAFTFSKITLASVGASRKAMQGLRMAYADANGAVVSATADFIGNDATFTGLGLRVPEDGFVRIPVYAHVIGIGDETLSGERLRVIVAPDREMTFAAAKEGRTFGPVDLSAGGQLGVPTGTSSDLTVRLTDLVAARHEATPSGAVGRGQAVEVLRFTLTAGQERDARLRKLSFRLKPEDIDRDGADSDVLERWADIDGDDADDNRLIELRRMTGAGYDIVGEGLEASIRYGIVRAGVADMTPQGLNTDFGDEGLIEIAFAEGSEHLIAAGTSVTYALALKTDNFTTGTWTLETRLLGGADFLWSDVPSGFHAPWDGAATLGIPIISPTLTVS